MKIFLPFKRVAKLILPLLAIVLTICVPTGPAYGAPDVHLSNWFANGLAGKKICFVGDSTTSNATTLFSELNNFYQKEGEGLYGVRSVLNFGENGASLSAFLSDGVVHGITATIAAQADLYVISYGINDVRFGQTTEAQLTYLLMFAVNRILAGVPNADIVLRMPNSFLSADINGYGFVQPNSDAPVYSTILRNAYKHLENRWSNVAILDTQDAVFGRASPPSSAYMANQIHPSSAGYVALAKSLVDLIGQKQPYDPVLAANALAVNPSAPYSIYPRVVENTTYFNLVATGRWVASSIAGAPNGYVDLDWPQNKSGDIHCGDLLQMDVTHVFALPPNCAIIPLGQNTRIYNLGSSLPSFTMTGGTVNVWRRWQ
jgi:lysophospholipase L1-like esterase